VLHREAELIKLLQAVAIILADKVVQPIQEVEELVLLLLTSTVIKLEEAAEAV
tara:strand:+ start:426 stop:584 length:159 start_codon:yes stop_codon:yes gene_type:complete